MLVNLAEAARLMGLESNAVKRPQNRAWELLPKLLPKGFPAFKVGRRWMVDRSKLERWISQQTS